MRGRDVVAVVVGLVVVGGVGYAGWQYLSDTLDPESAAEAEDDATATVEAYVAAWDDSELTVMRELVRDPPDDFEEPHEQLVEALGPSSVEVSHGELEEPSDGRAVAPVTVALELEGFDDPVSWETELEVLRERGRWGVEWSRSTLHPELRSGWGFATATEPVEREPILAADGTPLAGGEAATIGFVPQFVDSADAVVEAFAEALPGSESAAERELSRDLNDDWFYPVVTVNRARADLAWQRLRRTSGIEAPRSAPEARVLLDAGFAEHVVGRVSEATAEQLEEDDDLEPGDRIGQYGLEAVLEGQLLGSEVNLVGLRDLGADDDELAHVIAEGQDEPSAPVETTLEVRVQRAIENTLADIEEPAAIVAIDGEDGAVRGSASRPLGGFDRAFGGRYPPGSTFKLVTAEAALAAGADLDDEVACPAVTTVGGLRVPNVDDRDLGTTSFSRAFAESCNTTFATLGAELGADAVAEAATRFGFGVEPELPLSAFGGSFPDPGDDAELGAASFGQGRVEASPLHLASVAAAVVGGTWHQPYLLTDEDPGESRSLATGTPDRLQELLRTTVTDGTGDGAAVGDEQVGGKTGTAQTTDGQEHAWFIGTYDGLGFAVLVEDGGSGAEVAAPLAGEFVSHLAELADGELDPADPETAVEDEEALEEEAEETAEEGPDPDDLPDADADEDDSAEG